MRFYLFWVATGVASAHPWAHIDNVLCAVWHKDVQHWWQLLVWELRPLQLHWPNGEGVYPLFVVLDIVDLNISAAQKVVLHAVESAIGVGLRVWMIFVVVLQNFDEMNVYLQVFCL